IGYLFGYYKRLKNQYDGAGVTGKPVALSGSNLRPEATGYGVVYFAQEILKDHNTSLEGKTIALSGYGNVAWGVCLKASKLKAKVVSISGSKGYIYDEAGINTSEKIAFLNKMRTENYTLEDYATTFNAKYYPNEKPWSLPVDLVIPCATQNEITLEDAHLMVANKVEYLIEGSNMPTTKEALEYLKAHNVIIAPGKAANAGGVSVSALEMSQNTMRLAWSNEEVDQYLEKIMKNIYQACQKNAKDYGFGYDLIAGANIAGFLKVAQAMVMQGEY
ncbi:MAG: NADP-specific glutamate dehydrogenase, partial [Bacilli bacterium]